MERAALERAAAETVPLPPPAAPHAGSPASSLLRPPSDAPSLPSIVDAVAGLSVSDATSSVDEDAGALDELPWPTAADAAAAPSAPVLCAPSPAAVGQRITSPSGLAALPVNTGEPIEFETPMFAGRAVVWCRGLPGAPDALFAGRRRRSLVTVQGRFKAPVELDDLVRWRGWLHRGT